MKKWKELDFCLFLFPKDSIKKAKVAIGLRR